MAGRAVEIATVLGLVVMLMTQAAAQNGCSSVMMTLSPCLDFTSGKLPTPAPTCCSSLAGVVLTDPRCLCMVLDGSAASFGLSINHTKALELPGVCKVQTPQISQCTGVTAPPTPSTGAADAPTATNDTSAGYTKNAASLMGTMFVPAFALLYVL